VKFKYRKTSLPSPFSKKQILLRPIIPISLKSAGTALRYEALIDSGADFCIFPIEIGKKLGLDINRLSKIYFTSATGDLVEGRKAEVKLDIGDGKFSSQIIFADLENSVGILGQYGFFNLFVIKFDLQKEDIEINQKFKKIIK